MFGIGRMGRVANPAVSVNSKAPDEIANLLAWWDPTDVSGNDNDTVASWVDGESSYDLIMTTEAYKPTIQRSEIGSGDALNFDNTNDFMYINSTTNMDFDIDEAFSFFFVFKPNASRSARVFYAGKGALDIYGWQLVSGASGSRNKMRLELEDFTGTESIVVDSAADVWSDTSARTFGFTYDGSGGASGIKMYVNGSLISMTTVTDQSIDGLTNAEIFRLGSYSIANPCNGLFGDVAAYTAELTSAEVASLHAYWAGIYGI